MAPRQGSRRSGLEPAALRQRSLQELCAADVAPLLTGSVATLRSDLVGVHQVDGAIPLTLTRLPATAGPGTAWCLLELLDHRVNLADLDGLVRGLLASLESPTTVLEHVIEPSLNVGISRAPDDGSEFSLLLDAATRALEETHRQPFPSCCIAAPVERSVQLQELLARPLALAIEQEQLDWHSSPSSSWNPAG